jgi:hypothetical protein
MPAYTDNTNSPIYIPTNVGKVRIIAVGEGGAGTSYSGSTATNGDDGADTEFMGAVAYGGSAGNNQTAGTGGGATFPSSLYGTILSSSAGADGGSPATIDGGVGHTFTSPSLGSITKGAGEDGTSSTYQLCNDGFYSGSPYISGCPTTSPGGQGGALCANIPQPPDAYRHCYYFTNNTANGGGGGAGGFIEAEISSPELQSVVLPIIGEYNFAGSNQIYTVNNAGSGQNNGFLEVIFYLPKAYIKTSQGWKLVKNIYVKADSTNWSVTDMSLIGPPPV